MNSFVKEQFPIFQAVQAIRDQLMEVLSDDDLRYKLPGGNPTLGELCREMGEVEYSYIQSFRNRTQDFTYRNTESSLASSVAKLNAWFSALDAELKAVLEGFSEEELDQMINRGDGFMLPIRIQPHIYKEALLIFYGKVSVYLRAMEKPLPGQWQEWIG